MQRDYRLAVALLVPGAAHAHGEGIVLIALLWLGGGVGLACGVAAGLLKRWRITLLWSYVGFVGCLVGAAAVTTASLEVVPFALSVGVIGSVAPFVAGFLLGRFATRKLLGTRPSR